MEQRKPGEYPRKKQRKELEDLQDTRDPCGCKCFQKFEKVKIMEERERVAHRNEQQRKQFLYEYLKSQCIENITSDDIKWKFLNRSICRKAFFRIYAIKKDRYFEKSFIIK